jgi:hypothetical protein
VASAYHWAVFLRESADIELVKLPHHLDWWPRYEDEQRGENVIALLGVDWFLVHLPILHQFVDLTRNPGPAFEVVDVLWDRRYFEDMGPVLILRRRPDPARGLRLFRVLTDTDPVAFREQRGLPEPVHFARDLEISESDPDRPAGRPQRDALDFLGSEYQVLPSGHGWITYHYAPRGELKTEYVVVDRLTTPGSPHFWQNNHLPAWGAHPTRSDLPFGWQEGWIVSEGWPVIASENPYAWREAWKPLGGEWRRGEFAPADLWLTFAARTADEGATDESLAPPGRLEPVFSAEEDAPGPFSPDGLLRVQRFLLAVHPLARAADDGRPLASTLPARRE